MPDSDSHDVHQGRGRSLLIIRLLAFNATLVAGYLTWITLTHGTVAACGGDSSHLACDHVLRSPWSRAVGIPVSLMGCAVYASILGTSWWRSPRWTEGLATWIRFSFIVLVTLAVGSAVWFLILQSFVIGKFCRYCMIVHTSGALIAAIVLVEARHQHKKRKPDSHLKKLSRLTVTTSATEETVVPDQGWFPQRPVAIGLVAIMLLATLQTVFPAPTFEVRSATEQMVDSTNGMDTIQNRPAAVTAEGLHAADASTLVDATTGESNGESLGGAPMSSADNAQGPASKPPAEGRIVTFLNGRLSVDVHQHGLLGSPEADLIVVELVDYTCPDCRVVHQYLKQVREKLVGRFAVIVFPVPLETTCNSYIQRTQSKHVGACKYAQLALAVLSVAPDKFAEFHEWLMDSAEPPALEVAVRHASRLVAPQVLAQAKQSRRLQDYLRFYGVQKIGRLPAMIVADQVFIGVPNSSKLMVDMMEQQLAEQQ